MAAYLMLWNPKMDSWESFRDDYECVRDSGRMNYGWVTGTRKYADIGSRIFLMRLGVPPKGIIASGYTTSEIYQKEYVDSEGEYYNYVDFCFDKMLDPNESDPLDISQFKSGPLSTVHWYSQGSGILIPPDAEKLLENEWRNHLGIVKRELKELELDSDAEGCPEGKRVYRTHRVIERNPKIIKEAKNRMLHSKGKLVCEVCDFDFQEFYGKIGEGFIEGHHTIPLSQIDRETQTKVSDIALVCSNCHRMLHRGNSWMKIKQLKQQIAANRKRTN